MIPVAHDHSFTVFPQDCNPHNTLFGGKILAELDVCAAALARRFIYETDCDGIVTLKINEVVFKKPAFIGDLIMMYAEVINVGESSVTIKCHVYREDLQGNNEFMVSAVLVFVSVKDGHSHPHGKQMVNDDQNMDAIREVDSNEPNGQNQ